MRHIASIVSGFVRCLIGLSIVVGVSASGLEAKNLALEPKSQSAWKQTVNQGTVQILTKGLGCTCTVIASDMANVLNKTGELRVLPVIGHGSLQGIADVMYLRGIDLSILQADVLEYVERNGIHPNIKASMRYVTKLYNSELHLIAGRHIKTIQDLDGKLVSYDVEGRGSFITAENVFQSLGIETKPVHYERDVSIEKVKNGEIAAAFVVTGKPANSVKEIVAGDKLHLLPVPITSDLGKTYLPSTLTHEDYPDLIDAGESVETIAVPEVLAVYNWAPDQERFDKVKSFVEAFFGMFDEFDEPVRHPKWKDVDIAADIPGWQRFQPAQDWLDRNQLSAAEEAVELRVGDKIIRVRNDEIEQVSEVADEQTADQGLIIIDVEPTSSVESASELAFGIRLSKAANTELAIAFETRDGTAKANRDFKAEEGIMLIEPGVTTAELKIELINDQLKEEDEEFYLIVATNPVLAELRQPKHSATINDDD